jgi:MbtH protein
VDVNDGAFAVVLNDEEQYSIWPAGRELPAGWHRSGFTGQRADCLAHIDEIWTDIRPLSLRRAIAAQTQAAQSGLAVQSGAVPAGATPAGAAPTGAAQSAAARPQAAR